MTKFPALEKFLVSDKILILDEFHVLDKFDGEHCNVPVSAVRLM